jgi:hypothetical protein
MNKDNTNIEPEKERRSGVERRSTTPRRKEPRESWKASRRQVKDRRKSKLYNTDMDSK